MNVHTTDRVVTEALASEEEHALDERRIGFWIYLMSDAVLFSLLFATYATMVRRTAGGPSAAELFGLGHTFLETMLLLFSTFTFGLVTLAAADDRWGQVLGWLGVTFALGLSFVGLEISEFAGMIAGGAGPDRSGFLSAFFTLVGTHGLHVSAGLVWISVMSGQIVTCGLTKPVRSRLWRLGLFWHFLDLIWIGIFSFVYLAGLS